MSHQSEGDLSHPEWRGPGRAEVPPPPSDQESLDRLLDWVASAPDDRLDDMRHGLESIEGREFLLVLLHDALLDLPVSDVGRHLLVLSVIGQLESSTSIEVLEKFVWLPDADVLGAVASGGRGPCDFAPSGMLQARAAEMLMWVSPGGEDDPLRRILADHPMTGVRVAAIDAWLFVRDDTNDAADLVRQMARDEDTWAIGLPRFTGHSDTEMFEHQVEELALRYPEDPVVPATRQDGGPDVH